jgi:uncharacterized protein
LNAGNFYKADIVILGGDLVGKALVPIEVLGKGHARAVVFGRHHELTTDAELRDFEQGISDSGLYYQHFSPDELKSIEGNDADRDRAFSRAVRDSLDRWLDIADSKRGQGTVVAVMGGNDDPWFVDEILRASQSVVFADDQVLDIAGVELLSLGVSNITPWHTFRELEESDLHTRLARLAEQVRDPRRAVFNVHVPPFDTGLDEAPLLDESFRPVTRFGQRQMVPVGSTAVREMIDERQPLLGLHGHIHESRGHRKLGASVVVNPGSDYYAGRLQGALIDIKKGGVARPQLLIG